MKNKSFTLIELLVVIVIIGILAGVIMISTSSSIDKASIAKSKVFEESVQNNLAVSMVSKWALDGNTKDMWGDNNGTWNGAVAGNNRSANYRPVSECISGQCLNFDGTDDYIIIPSFSSLQGADAFTFSLWAYKINTIDGQIFWRESGFLIDDLHELGVKYRFRFNLDSAWRSDHSFSYSLNRWEHIVLSWDGINTFAYLNGREVVNDTLDSAYEKMSDLSSTLYIGIRSGQAIFEGNIDDIRIYNAALSTSQIKQNYIAGLNSMLSNGNISNKEYNERINELAYGK